MAAVFVVSTWQNTITAFFRVCVCVCVCVCVLFFGLVWFGFYLVVVVCLFCLELSEGFAGIDRAKNNFSQRTSQLVHSDPSFAWWCFCSSLMATGLNTVAFAGKVSNSVGERGGELSLIHI